MSELDARIRQAVATHDWAGVYPEIHNFCASDLSAFYFDIRKDALYCDRADSPRRRAARTVLDVLHRCLCNWLAPVLAFTAEEAWLARFPDEDGSVHLLDFVFVPEGWRDEALAEKWARVRELRGVVTAELEKARAARHHRLQLAGRAHPSGIRHGPGAAAGRHLGRDLHHLRLRPRTIDGRTGRGARRLPPRPGRQMRPLLAGPARGRHPPRPPHALPALRRRGGGPGVTAPPNRA